MLEESRLPLELPDVDKYLPTESGEPPLARAKDWNTPEGYPLETNTMPGFAGSSGYYLRYMDPWNNDAYFSREANAYWQDVDLYVGGDEHGTGHLIYSRFWNMFLFDIGMVCREEPYKRLINQGKIQGRSSFVYRISGTNTFVSYGLRDQYDTTSLHADMKWWTMMCSISMHSGNGGLNTRMPNLSWRMVIYLRMGDRKDVQSKHNVQNPDDLIVKYGADTLRMYEMFLGPVELSKPWDNKRN